MKDQHTQPTKIQDLPKASQKNTKVPTARGVKLAVIALAALLCVLVLFMVATALMSAPGGGTASGTTPRFANLKESNPVRQQGYNPSANDREGGRNAQDGQSITGNNQPQNRGQQGDDTSQKEDEDAQPSQQNENSGDQQGTQSNQKSSGGGANDSGGEATQSGSAGGQTQQEQMLEDLRTQQKTQEQQERILQEQRDAIPSPMGEQPPEPVDPTQ